MTCENEASPIIKSASPGAVGSTDVNEMVADDADRSTTTTRAVSAIRRASDSAVSVMLSLGAVPRIVILRAASPASRKSLASVSISVNSGAMSGPVSPKKGSGSATTATAVGASTGAGKGANATAARGAVMRRSSPVAIAPALSINVASVAISTTGSFLGYAGVLETLAREMIRPSAG